MESEKKILVRTSRTLITVGNNIGLIVPAEITGKMEIEAGEEVTVTLEEGKHGQYVTFWKNEKKD